MRRALIAAFVAGAALLAAAPAHAEGWRGGSRHPYYHHHHRYYGHYWRPRVFFGFGPAFWWGLPPLGWWEPPVVYRERTIVRDEPVYESRDDDAAPEGSWYYCQSARGYYPEVERCPEPWIPVPPRSE